MGLWSVRLRGLPIEEWQDEKLEQFGEERWAVVQMVMAHFARMGIFLAEVEPGNIMFAETG